MTVLQEMRATETMRMDFILPSLLLCQLGAVLVIVSYRQHPPKTYIPAKYLSTFAAYRVNVHLPHVFEGIWHFEENSQILKHTSSTDKAQIQSSRFTAVAVDKSKGMKFGIK